MLSKSFYYLLNDVFLYARDCHDELHYHARVHVRDHVLHDDHDHVRDEME